MWKDTILRSIIILVVFYCITISPLDGKKIHKTKVLQKVSRRSELVKPISDSKSDDKVGLIKKRKKRIKVSKDEQKPSQSRQMINIESFFNQFNLFSNSSLFSNSGSSSADQASPTRLVISFP